MFHPSNFGHWRKWKHLLPVPRELTVRAYLDMSTQIIGTAFEIFWFTIHRLGCIVDGVESINSNSHSLLNVNASDLLVALHLKSQILFESRHRACILLNRAGL